MGHQGCPPSDYLAALLSPLNAAMSSLPFVVSSLTEGLGGTTREHHQLFKFGQPVLTSSDTFLPFATPSLGHRFFTQPDGFYVVLLSLPDDGQLLESVVRWEIIFRVFCQEHFCGFRPQVDLFFAGIDGQVQGFGIVVPVPVVGLGAIP